MHDRTGSESQESAGDESAELRTPVDETPSTSDRAAGGIGISDSGGDVDRGSIESVP